MSVLAANIDQSPASFSLSIGAPLRPADWRWQLIRSNRPIGRSAGDSWLSATKAFINVLRPPGSTTNPAAADRARVLEDAADWRLYDRCDRQLTGAAKNVANAWAIYAASRQATRAELEARLLADEPLGDISKKLIIPIDTLNAYANVFFHVSDRLTISSWVIQCVFGDEYHLNFSERNYGLIWKVYSYFGGIGQLEAVIRKTGIRKELTADESFEQDRRVSLIYKAAIAARSLGVNGHTQLAILEHVHALDIHRSDTGQETPVAAGLKSLLEDVHLDVARRGSMPISVEPAGSTDRSILAGFENAFAHRIAKPKAIASGV